MIDKGQIIEAGRRFSLPVDPDVTKTYEAGRVLAMGTAADGSAMATTTVGASADVIIGVAWGDRTTALTEVKVETARFVDSSNNPALTAQLGGTSVNTSSTAIRVTNVAGTILYVITTDYTISAGGVLTRNGSGSIPAGGTVVVRYERNILASELPYVGVDYNRGSDDTLGFVPGYGGGICTVLESGIIPTDQYEEGLDYTPGAKLYISARGRLTVTSGTRRFAGNVRQGPTASYPLLMVDFFYPNGAITT